ncbi:MAG: hypothetical protein ISR65_08780 [Bacteriovoracaceae bacterium]|nr:hypothetical protein [Bacteriovoracaceae bacterium]
MKIDVEFDSTEQTSKLTFYEAEFSKKRDYAMAIAIVRIFSNDFGLEPELGAKNIEGLVEKTQELDKSQFTFLINDEGIEVDI